MEDRRLAQNIIHIKASSKPEVENFIESPCNQEAVNSILMSPIGVLPYENILLIKGPSSSGKTSIGLIASKNLQAEFIQTESQKHLIQNLIIDDSERWDEENLFHMVNMAIEQKTQLVLISSETWTPALPDLRSRINSIKTVNINEPDDQILEIFISSEFSKRSLGPSVQLVKYLKSRLPRNFVQIKETIDQIDKYCLSTRKSLSIKTISEIKLF